MRPLLLLVLAAATVAGCALPAQIHGPSALSRSTCAPRNDAVPPNGGFVVCMSGR